MKKAIHKLLSMAVVFALAVGMMPALSIYSNAVGGEQSNLC